MTTSAPPPAKDETPRTFSLAAVLSCTSGFLACDFADVHELIEHVAGQPIWTHELPAVAESIATAITRQLPEIYGLAPTEDQRGRGADGMREWVTQVAASTGLGQRVSVCSSAPDLAASRRQAWDAIKDKAIVVGLGGAR